MGATFSENDREIKCAGTKILYSLPSGVTTTLDLSRVPEDVSFAVRELLADMDFAVQDMRTHLARETERNRRLIEELRSVVAEKNQKVAVHEAALLENNRLLEEGRAQILHYSEECKKLESLRADAEIRALSRRVEEDAYTAKLEADVARLIEEQQDLAFAHSDDIVRVQAELCREKDLCLQLSEFLNSREEEGRQLGEKLSAANTRLSEVEFALRERDELFGALSKEIEKEKECACKIINEHEASLVQARSQIEKLTIQRDEWKTRFLALPKVWAIEKEKHVEKEKELEHSVALLEKECADLTTKFEFIVTSHTDEVEKLQIDAQRLISEHEKALILTRRKADEITEQRDEWKKQFLALPRSWEVERNHFLKTVEELENRRNCLEIRFKTLECNSSERIQLLEKECSDLATELELAAGSHAAEVIKFQDYSLNERKRISEEFTSILIGTKKREEEARNDAEKWRAAYAEMRDSPKSGPAPEDFQKLKNEIRRLRNTTARLQLEHDLALKTQTESASSTRVHAEGLELQLAQTREELTQIRASYDEVFYAHEGEKARAHAAEERLKAEVQHLESKLYLLNMKNEAQSRGVPLPAGVPPTTEKLAELLQGKTEEIEAFKKRLAPKRDVFS